MVTCVCEQLGSVCALEKVSDVDVETGTYVVVETDSCAAVLTYLHHLYCASLLTHHELLEISILTCSGVVTFSFCLEMMTVQYEL